MESKEPKKSPDKDKKGRNNFIQYTDTAFRMILIMLVGVYSGIKLDEWLEMSTPIFTLILALVSTGFAMYTVIKGVSKK